MNYHEDNTANLITKSTTTDCAHVDTLKTIWNKKEYRIFPIAVIKNIFGNKTLKELDKSIWLWIQAQACVETNWAIRLPRHALAEFFGKNERTISRSTKALVNHGYLEITQEEGAYATYGIRIPKVVADDIMTNTPNRNWPNNTLTMARVFLGKRYPGVYLSRREAECVSMQMLGTSRQEISAYLHISIRTLDFYIQSIKEKLGCQSSREIISCIQETDFITNYRNFFPCRITSALQQ